MNGHYAIFGDENPISIHAAGPAQRNGPGIRLGQNRAASLLT
jgi:hypothetical protein